MGRIMLIGLIALLAMGTIVSWHAALEDEGISGISWKMLYESKNERSMRMVPLFLMTSFSLIAIAAVLAGESRHPKDL
jgi:hypothetical protein